MALLNLLAVNSGSSSLKAALFLKDGSRRNFAYHHSNDPEEAFDSLIRDTRDAQPDLVGHRFVHGGEIPDSARIVDAAEFSRLESLVPLAPLHLPGNLLGIELCTKHFDAPQIACFDTSFHSTMPEIAKRLPVPGRIRRYGFHGLNYAHIAKRLPKILGEAAHGKVVAAHLGSGASLCLMDDLESRDTSMGYSPAGGIVMGTRCGDLDPGAMLELCRIHGLEALTDLVYHGMGLLALSSGESAEMKQLLSSNTKQAKFSVQYFCREVSGKIGSFAAKAGGIDALVFSGGIGEHSPKVREMVTKPLGFMGFRLDREANEAGLEIISSADSKPVLVLSADEEAEIFDLCLSIAGPYVSCQ
ncbi:MAG: acetate kinase [Burkholderiales bacterium]|nr:acetate kinase [Burkholderiales bacterium]